MTEHDIQRLIDRYIAGNATPTEAAQLESWYNRHAQEHPNITYPDNLPERMAQDLPPILATPQHRQERRQGIRRLYRLLPYVAAALLVASVVGWWVISYRQSAVSLAATEIGPGGNRATLTLADGRTINLDEAQTGIIVGAEDITYTDGSALDVMVSGVEPSLQNGRDPMLRQPAHGTNSALPPASQSTPLRSLPTGQAGAQGDAPAMLALTTPKGGTYQITLPDGSKAWLNANSTLKYPSRFSGDTREVILEGEAFFEIKKIQGTRDTRAPAEIGARASSETIAGARVPAALEAGARVSRVPFIVRTAGQVVQVLGTQFNISAYHDDPETKTTLVTGRVRVGISPAGGGRDGSRDGRARPDLSGGRFLELKPGQQAITRARPDESGQALPGQGAETTINEVDVEQYASWKDGFFYLEGTVPAILREISRWYDVEVVYQDEINDPVNLAITFPRDRALGDVLHVLQRAVPAMRYRVEELKRSNERNVEQRAERRLTIFR